MTVEQIRMLLDFLKDDSRKHTGTRCAELIGMSPSTFKKKLHSQNEIFAKNGFTIQGKTGHGNGYMLVVSDPEKYNKYCSEILPRDRIRQFHDLNDQKSRVRKIAEKFVESENYIKLDDLCEEFALSKAQMNKDMVQVRRYFTNYGIVLESRPHYGSRIVTDEISKRACLTNILLNDIGFDIDNGLMRPVLFQQAADELDRIREIIMVCADKYQYSFTDLSIQNLMLHLYIALIRIKKGRLVSFDEKTKERLLEDSVRPLAAYIVHSMKNEFDVAYNIDELCYVILYLTTNKVAREEALDSEVMEIVDEMLMRINERYHCDLSKNLDLRISLGLHTVPLLKRLQFHVVCHNPLLEEIQMNYLQAYDFALCACEVIGRRYQCTVAADEIAYYAVHFKIAMDSLKKSRRLNILIVCTSGRATSQLLKINFLKYFQDQLDQADTCNLFELSTRNLSRYDCVFSTVPIQKTLEIPVFQIKTFFDGERIKNIGQVFQEIIQENDDVFRRELFFHDITAADKESVLKEITERIGKCRPLPETFLASVLERESMQSTGFGCVALPHTHGAICEENLVSCTVLPEPVEWGNGKVQIVILTSYNHDFIKEHDLFFEFILELIKNQQYRRSLIEDPRYETLIRIFSDYRNEENNGK